MKMSLSLLPAFALLAFAAPAQAQDAVSPVTVRAELNFGYDNLRARYTAFNRNEEERFGLDGLTTGAEVGVDANFANLSAGVYAAIDSSQIDDCKDDIFFGDDSFCFDAGRGLKAGARAGLRMGDGGQIYFKAGYSRLKAGAQYTFINNAGTEVTRIDQRDNLKGYHVGAGAEVGLGGGAYAKGEYVYESFDRGYNLPVGDTIKPTRQQILFGVGFRFGGFGG